jgi:hypothetical protein
MRNLLEYPITVQECIDFLDRIKPQFAYENTGLIGGHDTLLIEHIKKALMDKLHTDIALELLSKS